MAVYVDDVSHPFGRMKMCHMWADSEPELDAFAARLGLALKWRQGPPKASWVHYDISLSKKALALSYGAVLTDKYEALAHCYRLTGNTEGLKVIEDLRARWKAKVQRDIQQSLDL